MKYCMYGVVVRCTVANTTEHNRGGARGILTWQDSIRARTGYNSLSKLPSLLQGSQANGWMDRWMDRWMHAWREGCGCCFKEPRGGPNGPGTLVIGIPIEVRSTIVRYSIGLIWGRTYQRS